MELLDLVTACSVVRWFSFPWGCCVVVEVVGCLPVLMHACCPCAWCVQGSYKDTLILDPQASEKAQCSATTTMACMPGLGEVRSSRGSLASEHPVTPHHASCYR